MSIVEVHSVSKVYYHSRYKRDLRATISDFIKSIFRRSSNQNSYHYVLKNIHFSLEKGEVLLIIGKNGAGKSTLLKILSRVIYPTSGEISINAKLVSLLELGAGFHSELTGKENIFLNATILGLTSQEINDKYNSIVSFSELSDFINTPLKYYSSGMKSRLAFSVAIHVESQILVLDEVLAVGDLAFRRKCFEVIKKKRQEGISFIIVSHDKSSELTIDKLLWLKNGQVYKYGDYNDDIYNDYANESS